MSATIELLKNAGVDARDVVDAGGRSVQCRAGCSVDARVASVNQTGERRHAAADQRDREKTQAFSHIAFAVVIADSAFRRTSTFTPFFGRSVINGWSPTGRCEANSIVTCFAIVERMICPSMSANWFPMQIRFP